jgi:SNF2 family DNA or RNA helicase
MSQSHTLKIAIRNIDTVYKNSLVATSPALSPPEGLLKVPLRLHQQTIVAAMEHRERALTEGYDISGENLYSRYGVLGDSVGVGKSLMVLGHIARCKDNEFIKSYTTIRSSAAEQYATYSMKTFSILKKKHSGRNEAQSLILVPHTLFRQWADYIKNQTNLTAFYLDKNSLFERDDFKERLMKSDVVLVANTMYKRLHPYLTENMIKWRRVYIDEADTIHLVSSTTMPAARFYWFITASWMNVLFGNHSFYMNRSFLESTVYAEGSTFHSGVKSYFETILNSTRPYYYTNFSFRSAAFFRELIGPTHPLQGHMILRCDDQFISESISLPQLIRHNILCHAPTSFNLVNGLISQEVRNLLHAGDTAAAMEALGVKGEDSMTLVQAVTKNRTKELDRLKKTFEFKSTMEYSSASAKEAALKNLTDKINEIESQVSDIQKRIENYKAETCPICYDEPSNALLTPCCTQIFCAACIFASLQRNMTCPMCRAAMPPASLKKIMLDAPVAAVAEEPQPEKKIDAIIRIIKDNPEGRFLIFSRYDNPFDEIEGLVAEMNIQVKQLKGNKDVINSTLKQFAAGKIQCLLLNAHYAGAGLNITAATHVILTHAMTLEEEKQILGRAYRLGRTTPLNYYKLLHAGETSA